MQGVFERYRRLQQYVGWTADDEARLRRIGPLLDARLPELIDDFYAEIERHPETRQVITGGDAQVARLKGTLVIWLRELFTKTDDEDYVTRRWRVGHRHVQIGLEQVFTNVAMSRLRTGLQTVLAQIELPAGLTLFEAQQSLNRRLDLDLAIIEDAYQTEYAIRQQRIERLAAIGQIAGGVAHEIRNPLNVIKTSAYYLLNAGPIAEEKRTEHLQRIEKQVGIADGVVTALSNFARMPAPDRIAFDVGGLIREVLDDLRLPESIRVDIRIPNGLPPALADAGQLRIVFSNLFRNAGDAMPDGGRLTIDAATDPHGLRVDVADTGCGISAEHLHQIMEPFFTTKARGIGLGLALSVSILTRNEGTLSAASVPGAGSTFTVRLETAPGGQAP